ncbi:MAG: hypothetical protein ABJC07_11565, partial [Acidobacteriota bacterium]
IVIPTSTTLRYLEADWEVCRLGERIEGPVSVDFASLASWEAEGSEHYVNLTGAIEDRWVQAFVLVRRRSARFARFHLNRARQRVSFLCRHADDPGRAEAVLGDLDLLVTLTNQRAALTEAEALDETQPAAHPAPPPGQKSGEPLRDASAPAAPTSPREEALTETVPPVSPDEEPTLQFSLPQPLAGRVSEALRYSLEAVPGSTPASPDTGTLARVLGTAFLVLEEGGSEDEAIAALLALEDGDEVSESRLEEIRERFGERTTALVRGCVEAQSALRPGGDPRLYSLYFRHSSAAVRRLICASKLRGARALLCAYRRLDFGQRLHFRDENNGTLQYYRSLVEAVLDAGQLSHLVNELDGVVLEMELAAGPAAAERGVKRPIDRLTDELADKVDLRLED